VAPTRSFWTWVGVAGALLLCTVFFFADHIGILLETLRNYLMIPGG
jgi:bacteriorhodopsin